MLSQEAMAVALHPSRVFESQNVIENNVERLVWKCLLCEKKVVPNWGNCTSSTVVAVRKKIQYFSVAQVLPPSRIEGGLLILLVNDQGIF
jgi:hypothetical protein